MLAPRLTTILPAMSLGEAIETMRIHRVAGHTGDRTALVTTRPCRAPHHTISDAGLIGGGHVPMPSEVSLAHHSVLFLDEFPGCRRHVLEVLRQPLEEGVIYRQSPARHRSASAGRPWRYERSMFPAKRDEGPSESCPLIEDRYRSKPLG
jgi:predicted ATPase with chaperone activity